MASNSIFFFFCARSISDVSCATVECANYSITTSDGTQLPAVKQNDIALYYELKDFVKIIESKL